MKLQLKVLCTGALLLSCAVEASPWCRTASANTMGTLSAPATTLREPYNPQQTRQTTAFWEKHVRSDPQGAIGWRNLAASYLELARETGTIAPVVKAEKAARQSLKIVPENGNLQAATLLVRALQTQHRFPEALALADRIAPLDPQIQRLRTDILLELGRIREARQALAKIPPLRNDLNLRSLSARIYEATGRPDLAFQIMQAAARQADRHPELPAETAAWYHTMVGHSLIDGGELKAGEAACHRALQIFPRDYRAMTGLAEAAAWRKDWKNVVVWGQKAHRINSENTEILQLLGDAHGALGQKAQAQSYYTAFDKLTRSFPRIYDRQRALFLIDRGHLREALAIAQRDLQLRQDAGAYSTVAWVLFHQKKIKAADAMMKQALQKSPQDAQTWYHAAMIARAARQNTLATKYFDRARRSNPYFLKSVGMS
jgi:tetratricopeptide (TPR) repeat protein